MKNLSNRTDAYLILILFLSIILNTVGISTIGMANPYYLAAVVSMVQNFHNFFFASFDPAGFVSIDKPPLALWIQTVFAVVFGIHGWSVVLPQALAGSGSVLLIYLLIRPAFGVVSARIAALILAITPVAVAVSRTNNVDSLLVFFLLLATLFLFRASRRTSGSRRRLFLAFAVIGLAFNIKMLEAYLILPAFIFLHLIRSGKITRRSIGSLATALIILIVVSLSWTTVVDAIPSQSRPFIGSSMKNSETDLAFGYNGTQRLSGQASGLDLKTKTYPSVASKGVARLFRVGYGTQISWFLPFVFFGIAFVLIRLRRKDGPSWYRSMEGREILFWIIYFLPAFSLFSFAGFLHRYYFVMIAPPIAALCGIALPAMYRRFTQLPGLRPIVFPVSLLTVLLLQSLYIGYYQGVAGLLFAITGLCLLFLWGRSDTTHASHRSLVRFSGAALATLLAIAPVYWSLTPVLYGGNHALPEAGPQLKSQQTAIQQGNRTNNRLIHYLFLHQKPHTFLFGTTDAPTAAPYIIKTQKPVMAIGGFNGTDPILTPVRLDQLIDHHQIRYFYFPSSHVTTTPVERWIRAHGKPVPPRLWAGHSRTTLNHSAGQLYDLGAGDERTESAPTVLRAQKSASSWKNEGKIRTFIPTNRSLFIIDRPF
ncbi:glycosyltransferase family 39 protein [Sporolactobacillus vineae]|uniref:glycosyltransferase family 39 protein n=1 Tax=Sporolactobacillus vineae TaxID=444463 RepID=UPI000288CCD4|nr:glycosyltransferase family 39 protein [Sporolactobacillus vineae]